MPATTGEGWPSSVTTDAMVNERARLLSGGSRQESYNGSSSPKRKSDNSDSGERPASCHSKISVWEASWCINNLLQGLPVIGLPYTILQGGYWALLEIIIFGALTCFTGKLLIDCLYERDEFGNRVRVRRTYAEIAAVCMGRRLGPAMVNIALLTELTMICTLFLIICGDLLNSFHVISLDVRVWILIAGACVLPYAFLKNIKYAAWISSACMVVHGIMMVVVLGICFSKTSEWQWKAVSINPGIQGVSLAAGVILTSNMGHPVFPITEGNMVNPEKFTPMLTWTYIAASLLKVVFAYIPFVTFGAATMEEVTNNLPDDYHIKMIVNVLIILRGLLSYSLIYITIVEMLTDMFFDPGDCSGEDQPRRSIFPSCFSRPATVDESRLKWWAVLARMGVILVTVAIAVIMPYFSIIAGLFVSLCGSLVAIIWPCLCHLVLFRSRLNYAIIGLEVFLIIFGVFYGVTGFVFSLMSLIEKFHISV